MNPNAKIAAFEAAHPAEYAWLEANARPKRDGTPSFAQSLLTSLRRWGSLTPRQLEVIQRILSEEAKGPRTVTVAGAGFTRLTQAFDAAKGNGLKYPKMRFDRIVISRAGDNSKNPGFLYVKEGTGFDAPYLGKVNRLGVFYPSRQCTPEAESFLKQVGTDPLAEAVKHGRKTGACSCCGRELSDPKSVELGIGPICKQKFGL